MSLAQRNERTVETIILILVMATLSIAFAMFRRWCESWHGEMLFDRLAIACYAPAVLIMVICALFGLA